jgi:hypothetical protein
MPSADVRRSKVESRRNLEKQLFFSRWEITQLFFLFATDKKSNRHASVDGLEKQLFFIRWEITQLFFLFATDKKSNRHASVDGLSTAMCICRRLRKTTIFYKVGDYTAVFYVRYR